MLHTDLLPPALPDRDMHWTARPPKRNAWVSSAVSGCITAAAHHYKNNYERFLKNPLVQFYDESRRFFYPVEIVRRQSAHFCTLYTIYGKNSKNIYGFIQKLFYCWGANYGIIKYTILRLHVLRQGCSGRRKVQFTVPLYHIIRRRKQNGKKSIGSV